VVGNLMDRWLFGGDDLLYLPIDGVVEVDEAVDRPIEMPLPSQVLEHFIKQAETLWVMNACICRAGNECQDYPIDLGCLFLGEAAAGINPELGRPVSQEEALDYVRTCREAGLVHLIGRNKLDTLWLGIGPGDQLLTICHCCPCCCLWRLVPHLAPQIGAKVTSMPGVSVVIGEACQGCGLCSQDVCFVDAIKMESGRAVIGAWCKGCGRCVDVCPQDAIQLFVEHTRFIEESIAQISPLVDLS
jgi:Pyruvate/2-oxoacid:ferredoxin oxidoreductase delta subunit